MHNILGRHTCTFVYIHLARQFGCDTLSDLSTNRHSCAPRVYPSREFAKKIVLMRFTNSKTLLWKFSKPRNMHILCSYVTILALRKERYGPTNNPTVITRKKCGIVLPYNIIIKLNITFELKIWNTNQKVKF